MKLSLSDLKYSLVTGLAGSIFFLPGEVELTIQLCSAITVGTLGIKSRVKYKHSETVPQQLKVRCLALGHYFTVMKERMGMFYSPKLGFMLSSTLSTVFPKQPIWNVGCSVHPPSAASVIYLTYDMWNAKAVTGASFCLVVVFFSFIF